MRELTNIGFWALLITGVITVIAGICGAAMHGKSKGNYNGGIQALNVISGIIFILIAYGIL